MLTPQERATVHKFIGLVTGDRSCLSDRQRRWLDTHKDAVAALHVTERLSNQCHWAVATWGRRPQIPPELVVGGGRTMKKLFVFFWVGSVVFLGQKKRPACHGPFSGFGWLLAISFFSSRPLFRQFHGFEVHLDSPLSCSCGCFGDSLPYLAFDSLS